MDDTMLKNMLRIEKESPSLSLKVTGIFFPPSLHICSVIQNNILRIERELPVYV
jgi:hypothetical protein